MLNLSFTATGGGVVNFFRMILSRHSAKRYFERTLGPIYKRIMLGESIKVVRPNEIPHFLQLLYD